MRVCVCAYVLLTRTMCACLCRVSAPASASASVLATRQEEALRKGVDEFGEGNWKKIQEGDSILKNRSAVSI